MTLAQRVGQLFIVGLAGSVLDAATAQAIRVYHFGSVSFIATDTAGVAGVGAVTRAVQSLTSLQVTGGARFFVAANQEGGEVQALQGPGFSTMPSAVAQGMLPPAQLRGLARTWGAELRAAGVNLNFAPVMDVVPAAGTSQNAPIGQLMREFGHTPAVVAGHGVAFIQGMTAAGEATTAKHFPGLGRVRGNTDFSAGVVDTVTTPGRPLPAHVPGRHRRGRAAGDGGAGHLYAHRPASSRGLLPGRDAHDAARPAALRRGDHLR